MSNLYSGLLWLVQPSVKRETELEKAVEYTQSKTGLPVRLIVCNPAESFPQAWNNIPIRPDPRVLPHHVFLVTEVANGRAGEADQP